MEQGRSVSLFGEGFKAGLSKTKGWFQQGLFSNQGFREPDRESLRRDQALAEMNMAHSRQ
jgi:hypothetical protein